MGWFRALPLLWRLVTVLGGLGLVLGAVGSLYAYVRHQGYADGYGIASAECEKEKAAQEAANTKAIQEATDVLRRAAANLNLKTLELDDAIEQIDAAAAADPDGATPCLPADSVQRLQTIR